MRSVAPRHRPAGEQHPAGPVDGPLPIAVNVKAAAPQVAGVRRITQPAPTEEAPADLRRDVESAVGGDLAGVRVHRSAATAAAAQQLGARAFTVGGEVHLPAERGPLTHGEARSTLAHELTHVVQQRRGGTASESSPTGQAMEAEAVAVARRVAPVSPSATPSSGTTPAVAARRVGPPTRPTKPTRPQMNIAEEIAHSARAAGITATVDAPGVQREPIASAASVASPTPPNSNLPIADTPITNPAASPLGQISAEALDELAARLYGGIQSRLRRDLLIRRERSGSALDDR